MGENLKPENFAMFNFSVTPTNDYGTVAWDSVEVRSGVTSNPSVNNQTVQLFLPKGITAAQTIAILKNVIADIQMGSGNSEIGAEPELRGWFDPKTK